DASGQRGIWDQEEIYGKWEVKLKEGLYDIKFKFIKPVDVKGRMFLETGAVVNQMKNATKTDIIEMKNVKLPEMEGSLVPFYMVQRKRIFPFWVELKKTD
ncbi:MAG: arylsulfatase, partial [Allomuricauda sp.]